MKFEGKKILIIGGSSGIGLSLVRLLTGQGAQVYNLSRTSGNWDASVMHLPYDIAADGVLPADYLPEQLHGLVYCAGSITLKPFHRLTVEDFLKDYQINVTGAVSVIQQSLNALKKADGASIVLLSSVAAQIGMPYHASIASAKAAVQGLVISLAAEFAMQNIRVNAIAPSLTDTPLAQTFLNTPEKKQNAAKRHPMGKYGAPIDVSNACAFLLSAQSSWITGQVICVDGGMGILKNQ